MKVLMLNGPDQKMGAPRSLMGICREWSKQGVEIIVVTQNYGMVNEYMDSLHIPNYAIPYKNVVSKKHLYLLRRIREVIFERLSEFLIDKILKKASVNLVYSNESIFRIGAYVSKKYNIPHIWHIREFGDKDYGITPLINNYYDFMNENASVFIAVSEAVKNDWINKGLDPDRIYTIYNGIDPSSITVSKHITLNQKIRILFCGSIVETKGQDQLVRAIAALPDDYKDKFEVDFWGNCMDVSYQEKLEDYCEKKGLDRIHFKGYSPSVSHLLCNYDIGVIASRAEGFGRVTVEYMMAGLCTIASNTGANEELIENNVTGILYKYGDIEDIKIKLMKLADQRDNIIRIGEKAREEALKRFTAKQNADSILSLAEQVVSHNGRLNDVL